MASIKKEVYVIPPGSRVLVTGANGFIGAHVVQELLSLGYFVRGTVRSQKPWLEELFKSKFGPNSFESIVIPDLSGFDALSEAMGGVRGVIHMASDVSFSPNADEVIPKVVAATENILEAAARQPEGSIQRVVLTSSASAAALPQPGVEGIVVTEDTWNTATVNAAFDENTPADAKPFTVYVASKTEGERAGWKWVKNNKPAFVFNSVLPYYTVKFVDVVDLARVHVVGLLHPEVKSERLFAFTSAFTWKEFVNILQKVRPGNAGIPNPSSET
ncbi:uncharacterized protein TRUGW13939_02452 [Talaromyces rugulosus]|uniref:NAD-dependent epimerase/dehydratase domain-containing protein n=1 Tax=Talaromyces rugulosus TaxID=121627 RepID=A0A7H8QN39_TALRU|nr:uncharacterized protein TRUGW13939_02452 [Talaromyces rugulosus]QKX55360.1 hypothetical protein TRUGW13939_02452 [Talaromyces rugulosus]